MSFAKPHAALSRLGLIATGSESAWHRHLEAAAELGPAVFSALCVEAELPYADRQYLEACGCNPTIFPSGEALLDASELDVVEIQAAPEHACALALRAAEKRRALLLAPPFACTAGELRALAETLKRHATPALALDPLRHSAIATRAQRLLNKDELLGEVHSLRLKTTIGRYENEAPLAVAQIEPRLAAHGAAPVVLLERLLGPIAELFAYGATASRMISLKFEKPGRYGVHEVTYSPDLVFPSGGPNWSFTLEATGTDGVLWLNGLAGQLFIAPPLLLKRKDYTTAYDDRVEDEFGPLCKRLRAEFLACPQVSPALVGELLREALMLEATTKSLTSALPVRLDG